MSPEWYPQSLRVTDIGNRDTIDFLLKNFATESTFNYAEFGVYKGATALAVARSFPNANLFLFDFHHTLENIRPKFEKFAGRVRFLGNSQLYNDNYNWSLSKLLEAETVMFDYVYLDGAHTFSVDALTYFLTDMVLAPGGFLDFDDYSWTLKGSSLDPSLCPEISIQYTQEQINDPQVKRIVEQLVRNNPAYVEVLKNKIFKKGKPKNDISVFDDIASTNSEDELSYLEASLSTATRYLEFGSGYSTTLAIQQAGLEIISVESDSAYLNRLRTYISSVPKQSKSIEFLHANIGPTKEWGYPEDTNGKEIFLSYTNGVWGQLKAKRFEPDLILIDGRFRVATFLLSLLQAPGAKIIFDDFMNRPEYRVVEDILPLSYSIGRFGIFRIPPVLTPVMRSKAEIMIRKYSSMPQ